MCTCRMALSVCSFYYVLVNDQIRARHPYMHVRRKWEKNAGLLKTFERLVWLLEVMETEYQKFESILWFSCIVHICLLPQALISVSIFVHSFTLFISPHSSGLGVCDSVVK